MVVTMRESGMMVNSMAKGNTCSLMAARGKAFGNMDVESNGLARKLRVILNNRHLFINDNIHYDYR